MKSDMRLPTPRSDAGARRFIEHIAQQIVTQVAPEELRGFCPTPQKGSTQSRLETLLPQSGIR